jgi:hypothetical protein
MQQTIEDYGPDQFASCPTSRNLRVGLGAGELEIQLVDTIDSVGDLFRFIKMITRTKGE